MRELSRRRQPHNPAEKIHDRRSTDLLRNAMVSPIEVDDPLEMGSKLIVMRSIRNDPLAGLHAPVHRRRAVLGRAKFQRDFEAAERGPGRSIRARKRLTAG
jgi:hypothetical protein